jgi:hypothetical protein
MSNPALLPQIDDPSLKTGPRWKVTIHNNDHTDRDVVFDAIVRATQCDHQEAEIEIWEAERYGRAAVHFAARDECDGVADVIRGIGVHADVSLEWDE